jgi:hypothetical protein
MAHHPLGTERPTRDQQAALCATSVTLNGEPARITGAGQPFARVVQTRTGLGAEWAWVTVAHVVANHGGRFQS